MKLRNRSTLSSARGWRHALPAFVLAFSSLCLASAQAAAPATTSAGQATGSIAGRVQNEATNQYLANARVTVQGTNIATLTDEFGSFRLNVPSGQVVLEVLYSGLDPQQVTVNVPPGQTVEQDVGLTSRERYGAQANVVQLDPFIAESSKLTEGEALATNEQRFAANIKNVVATDAFGDVTEGNVAEFMKYLPGVTVNYSDVMPLAVSVRGFDPSMTVVTSDGGQLANASRNATSRQFDFMQVSINNISRIEVTKVPTPANPASGISGSVNMVSKSAFERSKAQLNYRLSVTASSDGMQLKKQPFPFDTYERRVNPGFDFDYTLPITKDFGIVLTALSSKAWNEQNISRTIWNGRNGGATPSNPYLQSHIIIDAPKWYYRNSAGLKADWRVTPNSVLSIGFQATYYQDINGNVSRTANAGTNSNPIPASGERLTWGPDFTSSATGRGNVTFGGNFLHIDARTLGTNLRYRWENNDWRVETGGYASNSKTWLRFTEKGSFHSLGINLRSTAGVRVHLEDLNAVRPGTIRAVGPNNQEIDLLDINSFKLNTARAGAYRDHRDDTFGGDLNVKRKLNVFEFPAAIQVGGSYKSQDRDHRRHIRTFTYNPPDPADRSPAPFLAQVYKNRENYFGFDNIPWVSQNRAVEAWGRDPSLFTQTPAQVVAEESSRITGSEAFKETISALYAQAEFRLFRNRLTALTGVRYEKTQDKTAGPLFEPDNVWQRTASGAFARDGAGKRIRRPEAGALGSMEELRLTRTERGDRVNRSDDGYYPSLHLTFNATEKLLFRAAYAKTYGPPDFNNLIPNTIIRENEMEDPDPSAVRGTISIRNPMLKPWVAENYDLSAEYYTDSGGIFSAGVFRKDITDFFGSEVTLATVAQLTALGLDTRYEGWNLTTTFNSGDARVTGMEFNVRQSLAPVGNWGKYVSVFANATKLKLEGSRTADFRAFIPEVMNWGVTFSKNPVTLMLKWHHRGEQKLGPQPILGPDAFQYQDERTIMDVNLTYRVWKRHSLFVNGRNIFNHRYNISRYGPETPDYARRFSTNSYGVQWAFGVKGTF